MSRARPRPGSRGLASAGMAIAGGGRENATSYREPQYPVSAVAARQHGAVSEHVGPNYEPHPVVPGISTNFVPFHNIPPRSREVRRAQTDKETLEKQRLKARTGGFHKYDEFQTIVGFEEGTPGYQTEASRFDTDAAGEQSRLRQLHYENKQASYERRRDESLMRDERRWEQEQQIKRAEEEKWQHHREAKTFGKKNIGSVPYNQITLQYNDGKDGDELKYQDAMVRWRAMQRARRLQEKMMGENIDPITGQAFELLQVPQQPDSSMRPTDRGDVREAHGHGH